MSSSKHVAILLAGCGVYDGSKFTEAISLILRLERHGCTFDSFSLNKYQVHTVDHTAGSTAEEPKRNVMVESARIVRGKIQDIKKFNIDEFDAVIFPGGFGAKNLCSYAIDGVDKFEIDGDVKKMLTDCLDANKVLGLTCIAPMLLTKVKPGCKITLGKSSGDDFPYAGTITHAKSLGMNHFECDNKSVVVDEENKIVTCPAFMQDDNFYAVFNNIGMLVDKVVDMMWLNDFMFH